MIENLKDIKYCEVCGNTLVLNTDKTLAYYTTEVCNNIEDINTSVDNIIGRYLVYTCIRCGFDCKLTYSDIERLIRKSLTEKALLHIVRGGITPSYIIDCKFFIYCGKCSGFDGSGSCPKKIYDSCEVKRFPVYGL